MSATPLAAAVDPWQPPYHRHTSFRAWEQSSISDLRDPKFGCLHLTLFMVASRLCDCDHPFVIEQAKSLVPQGATGREAADAIRAFVRNEIDYVLRPKDWRASQVLEAGEGMCTNKAILQAALCRAVGLPAGFIITHLDKAVYLTDEDFDRDLFELIHQPTVHVFCAVWIPEEGTWRMYDATEPEVPGHPFRFSANAAAGGGPGATSQVGSAAAAASATDNSDFHGITADIRSPGVDSEANTHGGRLETIVELPATGETRYQARWLAGPFSPIQASLDSLLVRVAYRNDKKAALERQNEQYRQHTGAADHSNEQSPVAHEKPPLTTGGTAAAHKQHQDRGSSSVLSHTLEVVIAVSLMGVALLMGVAPLGGSSTPRSI